MCFGVILGALGMTFSWRHGKQKRSITDTVLFCCAVYIENSFNRFISSVNHFNTRRTKRSFLTATIGNLGYYYTMNNLYKLIPNFIKLLSSFHYSKPTVNQFKFQWIRYITSQSFNIVIDNVLWICFSDNLYHTFTSILIFVTRNIDINIKSWLVIISFICIASLFNAWLYSCVKWIVLSSILCLSFQQLAYLLNSCS